jgi:formylmethanofuran dehydrogenase subunit A
VTIYTPNENKETMFSLPRLVIKAGRVIVEQGEIREDAEGRTLHVTPDFDPGAVPDIEAWFEEHYTIQFANYPVDDSYLPHGERVSCASNGM